MISKPVEIFFSYSHKDEPFREQLETHLSMLKRQGLIEPWHDRMITAGDEWKGQINNNLNTADIVLLLVTANFLASDYCYDIEMMRAMERHEIGEARVVPIILTPVEGWTHSPFAKLQVLPKDGKPVTKWESQDEAFVSVAQSIRRAIELLIQSKSMEQPVVRRAESFTEGIETLVAMASGLSDSKRRRLEQEQNSLQQQYDLVNEKLARLREAHAIEVDPLMKLKLETQKENAQSELNQISTQLERIEKQLE